MAFMKGFIQPLQFRCSENKNVFVPLSGQDVFGPWSWGPAAADFELKLQEALKQLILEGEELTKLKSHYPRMILCKKKNCNENVLYSQTAFTSLTPRKLEKNGIAHSGVKWLKISC
uniref:Uncharacterized protein n=1 Tax=Xiphophorus couchianus TaxID=32473 RepID=A0A3B5LZG4_9TELE